MPTLTGGWCQKDRLEQLVPPTSGLNASGAQVNIRQQAQLWSDEKFTNTVF